MRVTSKVDTKRCRTPQCRNKQVCGRRFCGLCAARLDSIRLELEGGGNGSRANATAPMDEATAASFEAGLRKRAKANIAPTRFERLARAVRIKKYMAEGRDPKQISALLAIPTNLIRPELAWLAAETLKASKGKKTGGAGRNTEVDKKLLALLNAGPISNEDLSDKLGIPKSSVPSRISRLRQEGHKIPDRRGGPGRLKAIAA